MKKKKIILFGAGGHAVSCIDIIEKNNFEIVSILDTNINLKFVANYKVIHDNEKNIHHLFSKRINYAFITVGQIKCSKPRLNLFNKLKKIGFKFPTIVSPNSLVSKDSSIGEGTIILNNVVINSGVKIGKNCIINTSAVIEHGTIIGDNCHVSTGAIINGNCVVEKNSFIGSGSILRQDIKIKQNSFIKMGSLKKK